MFSEDKFFFYLAHQHYSKMGREDKKQHGNQKPPIVYVYVCVPVCEQLQLNLVV